MSTDNSISNQLYTPSKIEHSLLIKILESSVKSSRHFLTPIDISNIKQLIIDHKIFSQVNLSCIRNSSNQKFYEHFGFKTISRSELDGQGNPFPILHMELVDSQI